MWKRPEQRADAGNYAIAAILAAARGQGVGDSDGTSAAVSCIGLISRLFSAATVNPPELANVLTPAVLGDISRRLMLKGNAVYSMELDTDPPMFGAVGSFAVVGGLLDPNSWVYDLELPTPSGQMMRRELGAGLIHVRLNAPTGAPWRGTSPLADAGLSAAALAAIEQRLADESKARVGYLLTYPDGVSDATINGVRGDLQSMAGGVMPVESAGGGFRSGMTDARGQWSVTRFGGADTGV